MGVQNKANEIESKNLTNEEKYEALREEKAIVHNTSRKRNPEDMKIAADMVAEYADRLMVDE